MSHLLTTFFWTNSSFSGSSQLSLGAFFIGDVNKVFKVKVRGQQNYQGQSIGDTSVSANLAAWGVCTVPHGSSPLDVITSSDSDSWFIRTQIGLDDHEGVWAPNTDTAAHISSAAMVDEWAGQLSFGGAATDLYVCIKTVSSALPDLNTFGAVRLWWS